jgi:hypothetical protein
MGAIKTSRPRRMNAVKSSCHWPFANAVYIDAYLADPSDEACAVLWENIWRIGRSNFDRAQAESAAILYAQKEREQKIKDAHEFLKAELAELAELRRQVALLKERIAFLTPVPF